MPYPDALRRRMLQAATAVLAVAGTERVVRASPPLRSGAVTTADYEDPLARLARRRGGRLGVSALDTGSGERLSLRADERFGMCSTFKLLLAAAVLHEADAGRLALDTLLSFGESDMVPHAPVTRQHLASGRMRIGDLARAAQLTSDNVAANLLIRHLGGPSPVTALFRTLGDTQTRLDRYETAMNHVVGDEVRDTTTPAAMADTLARLFTTPLLQPGSRELLRSWIIATRTGLQRLRAGLPETWTVGDKTGTASAPGMPNRHNDIAVIWRPRRAPLVIAAYYEAPAHFERMRSQDDAVLAETGRIVAQWAGSKPQRS